MRIYIFEITINAYYNSLICDLSKILFLFYHDNPLVNLKSLIMVCASWGGTSTNA